MNLAEVSRHVCGIYCFIHRDTGRCYIGQSVKIGGRIQNHVRTAGKKPWFFSKRLAEIGVQNFDVELIEECSPDDLIDRESIWIQFYNSASLDGFNTVKKPTPTPLGYKHGELHRQRSIVALTGRAVSEETRRKISLSQIGKKISDETRAKLSISNRDRVTSQETKEKLSAAFKGRLHTWGDKISAAKMGHSVTEDTRAKFRAAWVKRKLKFNNNGLTDKMMTGRKSAKGQFHGSKTHPECLRRGVSHPRAKLSEQDVLKIRAMYPSRKISTTKIAARFSISRATLHSIILRKIWKHI
jgi:group I intron endonuclease